MKKYTSPTNFIYEKNNFASFVDTKAVEEKEFHRMMEFIKTSQLSHAMLSTPTATMKLWKRYGLRLSLTVRMIAPSLLKTIFMLLIVMS